LLYLPFQLWLPDAPTPTDAFRTLAAEVGTYGGEKDREFCLNADFHGTFRVLSHAANLRHGTHGFTSLPRKRCWGFFLKSDGFGRVWTHELGYQRPAR
jgi:hypothetical protein